MRADGLEKCHWLSGNEGFPREPGPGWRGGERTPSGRGGPRLHCCAARPSPPSPWAPGAGSLGDSLWPQQPRHLAQRLVWPECAPRPRVPGQRPWKAEHLAGRRAVAQGGPRVLSLTVPSEGRGAPADTFLPPPCPSLRAWGGVSSLLGGTEGALQGRTTGMPSPLGRPAPALLWLRLAESADQGRQGAPCQGQKPHSATDPLSEIQVSAHFNPRDVLLTVILPDIAKCRTVLRVLLGF